MWRRWKTPSVCSVFVVAHMIRLGSTVPSAATRKRFPTGSASRRRCIRAAVRIFIDMDGQGRFGRRLRATSTANQCPLCGPAAGGPLWHAAGRYSTTSSRSHPVAASADCLAAIQDRKVAAAALAGSHRRPKRLSAARSPENRISKRLRSALGTICTVLPEQQPVCYLSECPSASRSGQSTRSERAVPFCVTRWRRACCLPVMFHQVHSPDATEKSHLGKYRQVAEHREAVFGCRGSSLLGTWDSYLFFDSLDISPVSRSPLRGRSIVWSKRGHRNRIFASFVLAVDSTSSTAPCSSRK